MDRVRRLRLEARAEAYERESEGITKVIKVKYINNEIEFHSHYELPCYTDKKVTFDSNKGYEDECATSLVQQESREASEQLYQKYDKSDAADEIRERYCHRLQEKHKCLGMSWVKSTDYIFQKMYEWINEDDEYTVIRSLGIAELYISKRPNQRGNDMCFYGAVQFKDDEEKSIFDFSELLLKHGCYGAYLYHIENIDEKTDRLDKLYRKCPGSSRTHFVSWE